MKHTSSKTKEKKPQKKTALVVLAVTAFAAISAWGYGLYTDKNISTLPQGEAAVNSTIVANSFTLPAAEASGLIPSKQYPGVYWWHRDGGEATAEKPRDAIWAIKFDASGNPVPVKGTNKTPFYPVNAKNSNWEDIAIDPQNNIWIGEIGSNTCSSTQKLYKIAEPSPDSTATIQPIATYSFRFPDPAAGCTTWNSEAMFWLDGKMYIFAKTTNSPVYRIDLPAGTSGTATLVKLGTLTGSVSNISVSSVSPDKKRLAVASHGVSNIYLSSGTLTGDAWVKDIISRAPAYKLQFSCTCTGATVEGGSFAYNSNNLAFVSETREVYYAFPSNYGDTTPVPLSTDFSGDGVVGIVDLSMFLSKYGTTDARYDLDKKGKVDVVDLSIFLSSWPK